MKRVGLALAALLLLAGTFVGGMVVGRVTSNDRTGAGGISETQEDRLVDACAAESDEPTECVAWVAGVIEEAEQSGIGYAELADRIAEERRQDEDEAARQDTERRVAEICRLENWLDVETDEGSPLCEP